MQLRKILEKEMAKSNGLAELVKVPQERRPDAESLRKLNREVEGMLKMTGNQVVKSDSPRLKAGACFDERK